METTTEAVHDLQEDLIKIKTNQNSRDDSAMLYRLDVNIKPFQKTDRTVFLKILVAPSNNAYTDKAIIMPIAYTNSPPTLLPMSLTASQHPNNAYEMYYMLFSKRDSYLVKFDTYGVHFTVYSNIQLELVDVSEISIW